jgi:hypothetical protein
MREFLQKKAILAVIGGLGFAAGSYLLLGGESSKREALASTGPAIRKTRATTVAPTVSRPAPRNGTASGVVVVGPKTRVDEPVEPINRRNRHRDDVRVRTKVLAPMG